MIMEKALHWGLIKTGTVPVLGVVVLMLDLADIPIPVMVRYVLVEEILVLLVATM